MSMFFALLPAMFQTLFASTPKTQCPGMVSRTADGPRPQVDCDPTFTEVAVGKVATGPTPQTNFPGIRRRQERGETYVAQAEASAPAGGEARLRDQRDDRTGDEIPVVGQSNRNDRLDVEDVLSALVVGGAVSEIGIVLEWHADDVGHRVLRDLGEHFQLVLFRGIWSLRRSLRFHFFDFRRMCNSRREERAGSCYDIQLHEVQSPFQVRNQRGLTHCRT